MITTALVGAMFSRKKIYIYLIRKGKEITYTYYSDKPLYGPDIATIDKVYVSKRDFILLSQLYRDVDLLLQAAYQQGLKDRKKNEYKKAVQSILERAL